MLLIVDNYDSFTFNLVHYAGELGAKIRVIRNDDMSAADALALRPEAILLSPGPCTPSEAGISLDLIRQGGATTPILGVCLGHQAIGQAYGGRVIRAPKVMHGKTSEIRHERRGLFRDIDGPFVATRYHSLIVERSSLPDCLEITAETADGTIMGLSHRTHPVHGVQFHPESIASQHGHRLIKTFLDAAALWNERHATATAA